ncbi:Protein of unknown function [Methylobacterium sp. 174MFSha1.1]|uniref:coiled-coil domain-containing protein n=1 Tax=Methylobacterium sp. 174MFSha1.1 TaxID=1502749 RepID=UPI0008EA235D|nr:coiled-coil domain-containing protein [Methylobacterium sp. 174MFSha1.1]SFV16913.1 Protein of unknown function [Methylobacterium sp. 174MFSha1.1]
MTSIAFDTLKFARTLRDRAKMSPEQAEGLSDALLEAIQCDIPTKADLKDVEASIDALRSNGEALRASTKSDIEGVKASIEALRASMKADIEGLKASTKADIEGIKSSIKVDLEGIKASIDALRAAAKSDVEASRASSREAELRLEARMEASKTETIKWVVGLIGFQILAVIGSVIALARILKP